MSEQDELTRKEKIELAKEAGISAIPYLGGSIQTLYYGTKNEKRFKRIERFYEELIVELESIKNQLNKPLNLNNEEDFIGLLESINDEVEKAMSQSKIENYKKAFKNILLSSESETFQNEKFFVQILPSLTDLELNLLYTLYLNKTRTGNPNNVIDQSNLTEELVTGSMNRLLNYGLVYKNIKSMRIGGTNSGESAYYQINELGLTFIRFVFE